MSGKLFKTILQCMKERSLQHLTKPDFHSGPDTCSNTALLAILELLILHNNTPYKFKHLLCLPANMKEAKIFLKPINWTPIFNCGPQLLAILIKSLYLHSLNSLFPRVLIYDPTSCKFGAQRLSRGGEEG